MLAGQLAHPGGIGGQWLGKAMDLANRGLTRRAVEMLAPQGGEAVLDAGCGTGIALARVRKAAQCRIAGLDPSRAMVRMARRRLGGSVDLRNRRIEDEAFPPESFDAILALNVLYFAGEEAVMPCALYRMLRPGGRLVAYVTARETMERWRFARAGYHRLYDEGELARLLCEGGFAAGRVTIRRENVGAGAIGLFAYATR
ncbi:hypothetical protein B2G71_12595 [Novosphingobium sp. PC22D]|nr:hypothetical protein B2G71_12595 [Novosphingobium sp. PC22D]